MPQALPVALLFAASIGMVGAASAQPAASLNQGLAAPSAGPVSSPEATLPELAATVDKLRQAEAGRQAQTAQLTEQVKHLRGQVEWHEAVLPWMGAALALLAGGLGLTAAWSTRRLRAAPHAKAVHAAPSSRQGSAAALASGASSSVPPMTASASRPGSLPPAQGSSRHASPASAPGGSAAAASPAASKAAASAQANAAGPTSIAGHGASVAEASERSTAVAKPAPSLLERPEFVSSTRPVPQLFSIPDTPAPLLSADALIDLEQQADFFVALGQEDAAVERLVSELRTVDGHSPMPWLKLLDIHRKLGDRVSYQRALDRFRQRFGPHGADWHDDTSVARGLDDYPEAVARLQALWPAPADAMTLLERLVGGCEPTLVLSLPASQDALLLYQLARSFVPGSVAEPASDVDLLLPMDSAAAMSGRATRGGRVDLDLSSGLTPLA